MRHFGTRGRMAVSVFCIALLKKRETENKGEKVQDWQGKRLAWVPRNSWRTCSGAI